MSSDVPEETPPEESLPEGAYRLLVPVFDDLATRDAERLLETAAAIARGQDGALLIASLVTIAPQTPIEGISPGDDVLVEARARTEEFVELATDFDVPAAGVVRLTQRERRAILDLAEEHDCDGIHMVLDSDSSQRRRLLGGDTVEAVVARAECDVFVEKQRSTYAPVESVLLSVSGGPHSGLAAETARGIAIATGASVDAVHFLGDATDEDPAAARRILEATEHVFDDVPQLQTELTNVENVAEEIITRSDEYDVTVLGAPTSGLLEQFVFGTVPDSVSQRSDNAVVMVQQDTGHTSTFDRWIRGDPVE